MTLNQDEPSVDTGTLPDDDRRKFFASCGKFAVVTMNRIGRRMLG